MDRGPRVAVAIAAAAGCALAVSACDDFRDVEVTNGCDLPVDVADSNRNAGYGIATVDPGAMVTAHSSGGPFDIVIRATGSEQWETVIRWDEMSTSTDDYMRTVTIESDKCPTRPK